MRVGGISNACLGLFIAAWLAVLPAQADGIKLVSFQYPPLVYLENNEVKGVASALVREVFDQLELAVEIDILPWARALRYVEHGQADAVFTIFRNRARERFLTYTDDYLIEQVIMLYTRADRPVAYNGSLTALSAVRIGVTRAVSYGPRFDRAMGDTFRHLTYVNDEQTKFLLLDKGRVDVVVSNVGIADFYLDKLQLRDRIVQIPVEIERIPSYLAFSSASPRLELLPEFEAALARLKASGRYQQILAAHGYAIAR